MLAYIKMTIKYGITYYNSTSLQPVSLIDSNYNNDHDTWRSTDKHVFYVERGPVS